MTPLLTLLFAPALAGSVFASVDDEVTLGMGGTWARLHPSAEGWWFFQGAGGDYWAEDLTDDLGDYDDRARIQLTERGDLQDTQVERCDDGGWLVLGSATIDTFDDSAYAFRSNADFQSTGTLTVEEREDARAHNDMAVLCSDVATGVAYANGRGGGGATFFDIDSSDTASSDTDGVTLGASHTVDFNAMGGSLAVRPSDQRIVAADVEGPDSDRIHISVFDADWTRTEEVYVDVPEGYAFWPQRLLPFGDGWILAYLTRPSSGGGGDGEVWLAALDAGFNLVDSVQVSDEGTLNARPWVVRKGDVLGVSYDRDVQPRITLVRLQADAVPDGDGLPDTGPHDDDTADTGGGGDVNESCGCASSAAPGWAWGAVLAAGLLVRGRRR
ncbi:MAG: MYXO-CTERM sorting domain-containing protein [Pseudomonadota bacterium]|nr:MYXO-CTERM sorting domain-containing protein [Pseudomonadota bacterium]